MSQATIAYRRNQNLYRTKTAVKLGPASVGFLTVAAICTLALLYLNQITKTSVYGYRLTELTRQRDTVLAEKQDLEVQAARLQSIQQIQGSSTVAKMVPEGQATYAQ